MKIDLLCLLLPFALGGCIDVITRAAPDEEESRAIGTGDGPKAVGTGKPIVENRRAEAAKAIDASGALTVEIRTGPPSLIIEAQKEILPHIKTRFENGCLHVWTEGSLNSDGTMRVRYTTPTLSGVVASGATTIDAQALTGDSVGVELTGASKLRAEGRADRVKVEATGASEAQLKGVDAQDVVVEATGASRAWVTARKSLKASATGASEVRYYGRPASAGCDASGASSVGPG